MRPEAVSNEMQLRRVERPVLRVPQVPQECTEFLTDQERIAGRLGVVRGPRQVRPIHQQDVDVDTIRSIAVSEGSRHFELPRALIGNIDGAIESMGNDKGLL